jgi:hypothetical protein
MSRKAKIHILSPFDLALRAKKEEPNSIPSPVVKALIAGLLSHLWSLDRRKTREMGLFQEEAEKMLWSHVVLATEFRLTKTEQALIEAVKEGVPHVFASLTGHTYRLFAGQSDLIIGILQKASPRYSSFRGEGERQIWIKKHLPSVLAMLKQYMPCNECFGEMALPEDSKLKVWAETAHEGELRNNILAWFHDRMSPATIKRILATKPSVPTT